jgi:replicative DNA helicase
MRELGPWLRKKNFAFISGCQQNRQSVTKDGEIGLSSMKGSGTLEEGSDVVLVLTYPYQLGIIPSKLKEELKEMTDMQKSFLKDHPGLNDQIFSSYFEIGIAKQKDGPTKKTIQCKFNGETLSFSEWNGIREFFP